MQITLMTGTELSPEEADTCERNDIPVLRKPFLGEDAINLIQARMVHQWAGAARVDRNLLVPTPCDPRASGVWKNRRRTRGR